MITRILGSRLNVGALYIQNLSATLLSLLAWFSCIPFQTHSENNCSFCYILYRPQFNAADWSWAWALSFWACYLFNTLNTHRVNIWNGLGEKCWSHMVGMKKKKKGSVFQWWEWRRKKKVQFFCDVLGLLFCGRWLISVCRGRLCLPKFISSFKNFSLNLCFFSITSQRAGTR